MPLRPPQSACQDVRCRSTRHSLENNEHSLGVPRIGQLIHIFLATFIFSRCDVQTFRRSLSSAFYTRHSLLKSPFGIRIHSHFSFAILWEVQLRTFFKVRNPLYSFQPDGCKDRKALEGARTPLKSALCTLHPNFITSEKEEHCKVAGVPSFCNIATLKTLTPFFKGISRNHH